MEPRVGEEDVALKELTVPTTREAEELARMKALDKREEFCKISRALAVLASASVKPDMNISFIKF